MAHNGCRQKILLKFNSKLIQHLLIRVGKGVKGIPIVRESSGLALSSRNMLLSAEEHKKAPIIYQILSESCIFVAQKQPHEVRNWVLNEFQNTGLDVEYFEIVDGYSLQPVSSWNESDYIVGCIAVFCGKIRLIDNIPFKR